MKSIEVEKTINDKNIFVLIQHILKKNNRIVIKTLCSANLEKYLLQSCVIGSLLSSPKHGHLN